MNEQLLKSEYCRILFDLEFQERFILRQEMLLRLRREFIRVARMLPVERGLRSASEALLDPELPDDPYARRLYQKPSPAFVITPLEADSVELDCGDALSLEVLFFGDAANAISLFAGLLRHLGDIGFYRGEGRFELIDFHAVDLSGNLTRLPLPDVMQPATGLIWLPLQWAVDKHSHVSDVVTLRFETPARLLSSGKPLFAPDFASVFPFILRKVSSQMYSCYGQDLVSDPAALIEEARGISVDSNSLSWHDWRILNSSDGGLDLGGVVGDVVVSPVTDMMFGLLVLGSLFHIGKNAAYGCGSYKLL